METYIEEQEEILENLEAQFKKFKRADPDDSDTEELKDDIEDSINQSTANLDLLKTTFRRYKKRKKNSEKLDKYESMINDFEETIKGFKEGYKKTKKKHVEVSQNKKRSELFEHDKTSSESEEEDNFSGGDADFAPSRTDNLDGEVGDRVGQDLTQVEMEDMDHDEIAHELFKEVYDVQNENLQIAHRLCSKADQATEIASEVIEEIELQNEKLRQISAQLDDLGGSIKRALKELYGFSRGLATEYAMLLCICCCACVVFIVVLIAITCKAGVCNAICDLIPDAQDTCRKVPGMYTVRTNDDTDEEKNNANITSLANYNYGGSVFVVIAVFLFHLIF